MIEFKASHRFARVPARKIRPVMDLVRGLPVNQALDLLRTHPRRAAVFLNRVLRSAVANASQDPEVNLNHLIVWRAFTDGGPLHQGRLRWRPGPMGRAMPIRKRTSHITIIVADPTATATERTGTGAAGQPAAEQSAGERAAEQPTAERAAAEKAGRSTRP